MREKTSPPARTEPKTLCDQPSGGLIAKAEKPTRSAGAEPVLANRSHRTSSACHASCGCTSRATPGSSETQETFGAMQLF